VRSLNLIYGCVILGFLGSSAARADDINLANAPSSQDPASASPDCRMRKDPSERVSEINDAPSYFAKVTADGRYMCYITDSSNHVMDLNDPSTQVLIPGPYDPVPAPPSGADNQVHTISAPTDDSEPDNSGMQFFDMKEILANMSPGKTTDMHATGALKRSFLDPANQSDYQSIGIIPGTKEHPVYRMLNGSLSVEDYDTRTQPWTIAHAVDVCGGDKASGTYQLPMISKTGQELSIYDTADGHTKIMKINPDFSCTEELDLGFGTGKVEFAYDNSAITFHVDNFKVDAANIFSGVSDGVTKNVYMIELKHTANGLQAGALRKITSNEKPGEGSYYPSFTQDGKIVYIQGDREANNNVKYSFHTVNPALMPSVPLFTSDNVCASPSSIAAFYALGSMWSKLCSSYSQQLAPGEAALWTLSLDPVACKDLVRKNWSKMKSQIASDETLTRSTRFAQSDLSKIDMAALEAACPKTVPGVVPKTKVLSAQGSLTQLSANSPASQTAATVFHDHCASCHNGRQAKLFDFVHPSADDVNAMLIGIYSGDMPRERVHNRQQVLQPLIDDLVAKQQKFNDTP
jgi:hypothetical protein